jgi:CRISPR-associated Csx2 family protein
MKEYTLIASLGTGMYKDEGGYQKTKYQFTDGKVYETSLLLKAILETGTWPIKKVILIGTRTSSWDILIPDDGEADLWFTIKEACKNEPGISQASIDELEKKLPHWYHNIPFVLKVHTPKLDAVNAEAIFTVYMTISGELAPDTDVLFDITHGFRSMPILIYQALQLDSSKLQNRGINLIYGELIDKEKISYVRDLSKYWDFYEITAAKQRFTSRFDGKVLAEKIKPYWESGAKCLVRFSEIVECNYSLQIPDLLKQIRNAIEKFNTGESGVSQWVIDVKDELAGVLRTLYVSGDDPLVRGKTLRAYARLLEEKGLITQGVIALQIAIETAVIEKCGGSNYIGDYKWWQEHGKIYFSNIKQKSSSMSISLQKIENLRNQIAHGGAKDRNSGEYPHLENLPTILKNGNRAADTFFALLEED